MFAPVNESTVSASELLIPSTLPQSWKKARWTEKAARWLGSLLVPLAGTLANFAVAADTQSVTEKLATRATIDAVRAGGFVLNLRHGNTDTSHPDCVSQVDLGDCSTQRPLIEEGRRVAAQVGAAVRKARIPAAHAPSLMGYFIKPEGSVAIFQPLGEKNSNMSPASRPSSGPSC